MIFKSSTYTTERSIVEAEKIVKDGKSRED